MKILTVIAAIALVIALIPTQNNPDASEIPLHEPNGKCHTPYNPPNECRHSCDHTLCKCAKECDKKCKDDGKCIKECVYEGCWGEHHDCSEKCPE